MCLIFKAWLSHIKGNHLVMPFWDVLNGRRCSRKISKTEMYSGGKIREEVKTQYLDMSGLIYYEEVQVFNDNVLTESWITQYSKINYSKLFGNNR